MKERPLVPSLQKFLVALLFLILASLGEIISWAQTQAATLPKSQSPSARRTGPLHPKRVVPKPTSAACEPCIRAEMAFLASDALRGRGSGTTDELLAATYLGSQLQQYGVEPAGDDGTYIQRASVEQPVLASPPQLHFMTPGDGIPAQRIQWTHGKEMLALSLSDPNFKGPLKRIDSDRGPSRQQAALSLSQDEPQAQTTEPGTVVLIVGKDRNKLRAAAIAAVVNGAKALLVPAAPEVLNAWEERSKTLPALVKGLEGSTTGPALGGKKTNVFALNEAAMSDLNGIPDGTTIYCEAAMGPPQKSYTWNALGKLTGSDPALRKSAILLTAHLDHLGVGAPVNGDDIYNGADDDASGSIAVLQLARALGSGPRPKRTVLFALFGSEEDGGLGSSWFEQHPPMPLSEIAANLEFEMIGRPDPKYPGDSLWLSGWQRTNLGPALAAHGANLVADARPGEHFFMRSDNYVLAQKGVVAQTASSYGLHSDYHQPSDDLAHIDFRHMTAVIASLTPAIEWLANSSFKPEWKPGGKP